MKKRTYATLQDYMEATGTNRKKLAELSGVNETHLSKILTRSRRCSLEKAVRLHMVTGVPIDNLVRWMINDKPSTSERPVKTGTR